MSEQYSTGVLARLGQDVIRQPAAMGHDGLLLYCAINTFQETKSVSRAHLLLHNTLEIININPPAGPGMRSPEPDGGLT